MNTQNLNDKKFEEQFNKRFDKLSKLYVDLLDTKLSGHLADIDEKLLKWKTELFNTVDSFGSEIRDSREARLIGGHQTIMNTDRIERLEKKVFGVVSSV